MTRAELLVERQRLPDLKDLTAIIKDMNKVYARIKIAYIEETSQLASCTAEVVREELGVRIRTLKPKSCLISKWKIRLEANIKKLRSEMSNLKNTKEQN